MRGIYADVKDVQIIRGYAFYQTAWEHYQTIKESLGKKPKQKLTVKEFCEYEGITVQDFYKIINTNMPVQLAFI